MPVSVSVSATSSDPKKKVIMFLRSSSLLENMHLVINPTDTEQQDATILQMGEKGESNKNKELGLWMRDEEELELRLRV